MGAADCAAGAGAGGAGALAADVGAGLGAVPALGGPESQMMKLLPLLAASASCLGVATRGAAGRCLATVAGALVETGLLMCVGSGAFFATVADTIGCGVARTAGACGCAGTAGWSTSCTCAAHVCAVASGVGVLLHPTTKNSRRRGSTDSTACMRRIVISFRVLRFSGRRQRCRDRDFVPRLHRHLPGPDDPDLVVLSDTARQLVVGRIDGDGHAAETSRHRLVRIHVRKARVPELAVVLEVQDGRELGRTHFAVLVSQHRVRPKMFGLCRRGADCRHCNHSSRS